MDLKDIVELVMRMELSTEERKAWVEQQDKKFRD